MSKRENKIDNNISIKLANLRYLTYDRDIEEALKVAHSFTNEEIRALAPQALNEFAYHALSLKSFKLVCYLFNNFPELINTRHEFNQTPLHIAVELNEERAIEYLIAVGANVDAKDDSGMTPLHMLYNYSELSVANLLIEAGADVNAKDKYGNTPLHLTALNSKIKILELLISSGADLNLTNNLGQTPFDCFLLNEDCNVPLFYNTLKFNTALDLFIIFGGKISEKWTNEIIKKLPNTLKSLPRMLIDFDKLISQSALSEDILVLEGFTKLLTERFETEIRAKFSILEREELSKLLEHFRLASEYIPEKFYYKIVKIIKCVDEDLCQASEALNNIEAALRAELEIDDKEVHIETKSQDDNGSRSQTRQDLVEVCENLFEWVSDVKTVRYLFEQLKNPEIFAAKLISKHKAAQIFQEILNIEGLPDSYINSVNEFLIVYDKAIELETFKLGWAAANARSENLFTEKMFTHTVEASVSYITSNTRSNDDYEVVSTGEL